MDTKTEYKLTLGLSRKLIMDNIQNASEQHDWLFASVSEQAVNEIGVIAIAIALNGIDPAMALALAIKAHSDMLNES